MFFYWYFKAAQLHKQNAVMYACAVRECACGARVCVDACVSACGARECVQCASVRAVRECACMGGAGVSACGAARYMRIRLERYYFFMTYGNIIFLQL